MPRNDAMVNRKQDLAKRSVSGKSIERPGEFAKKGEGIYDEVHWYINCYASATPELRWQRLLNIERRCRWELDEHGFIVTYDDLSVEDQAAVDFCRDRAREFRDEHAGTKLRTKRGDEWYPFRY